MDKRGQVPRPGRYGVAVDSVKGLKALQEDRMRRAFVAGARWRSWKDFRVKCFTDAAVYTTSNACTGVLTLRAIHGRWRAGSNGAHRDARLDAPHLTR